MELKYFTITSIFHLWYRFREKVIRGIKKDDSAIIKGMQIHHNFIRPHQGLDGDTPADRAGIRIQGNNKWLTIIQNAALYKKNSV